MSKTLNKDNLLNSKDVKVTSAFNDNSGKSIQELMEEIVKQTSTK